MRFGFFELRIWGAVIAMVALMGCASFSESHPRQYESEGRSDDAPARGGVAYENDALLGDESSNVQLVNATPTDAPVPAPQASVRKVIYTAHFSVLVASNERAITDFLASVTTLGGHLSQRQDNTLTVRVPAENFRTLTDSLGEYGAISSQNISSQDVTDAYLDIELRLGNAKNARARLLALMQSATKTEDLLKIEREITRLSEVIETLEGKLRHMGDRIAFSTVTVRFFQNSVDPIPVNKRKRSRFEWINLVGVEHALQNH